MQNKMSEDYHLKREIWFTRNFTGDLKANNVETSAHHHCFIIKSSFLRNLIFLRVKTSNYTFQSDNMSQSVEVPESSVIF